VEGRDVAGAGGSTRDGGRGRDGQRVPVHSSGLCHPDVSQPQLRRYPVASPNPWKGAQERSSPRPQGEHRCWVAAWGGGHGLLACSVTVPHVPPLALVVRGKRGRSFKLKPGGTQRMGIMPGSGVGRQSPSRVPRPSGDFVPSPSWAASPLGAGGCPEAAWGGRRCC